MNSSFRAQMIIYVPNYTAKARRALPIESSAGRCQDRWIAIENATETGEIDDDDIMSTPYIKGGAEDRISRSGGVLRGRSREKYDRLVAASLVPIHCANETPGTRPMTSFTSHISRWWVTRPCSLNDSRVMIRN
jgi:hypothetical protein